MKTLFGLALFILMLTFLNFFFGSIEISYLQSILIVILLVVVAYRIEKLEDKN